MKNKNKLTLLSNPLAQNCIKRTSCCFATSAARIWNMQMAHFESNQIPVYFNIVLLTLLL